MDIYDGLRRRLRDAMSPRKTTFTFPPVGAGAIEETIVKALTSAGIYPPAGPMKGVWDTTRQPTVADQDWRAPKAGERGITVDGVAREIIPQDHPRGPAPVQPAPSADPVMPGKFISSSFTNHVGTRTYKLFIPSSYARDSGNPFPLVVMLHGCTQSSDDFATGTRMNVLAEQHGFLVVYPAQTANANGSKCWNWFRSEDQGRDRGEPALIAGITEEVLANYDVDERRIFVAGLSAGAAMAVILGTVYPDIYAAVGAHSGLPYGAAHDVVSAFGAMKKGGPTPSGMPDFARSATDRKCATQFVPTIVFHGDVDHTVDARNGSAIIDQAMHIYSGELGLKASVRQGIAAGNRTYHQTVYANEDNQSVVEQWLLHGAGHAWSGGSPNGSYTDPRGPDASAEMVRFFYSQQRAGCE